MKISIQGVKGAFHEEAARAYFSEEISIVENLSFEGLVRSVESGEADAGIMAIENTISGTIHKNYELIKNGRLSIVGETYLRIVQNLAVNKGVQLSDLREVASHYMAINQCHSFFSNYPNIKLVESEDTALSMKKVADNNSIQTGAIGSKLAAAHYNLEIIGEGIETNKKNFTRFLILKKNKSEIEQVNKASVQFVLGSRKGSLANVLNIIYQNNIDLCKIESLPIVGEPWHYQFYVDMLFENKNHFTKMLKEIQPQLESMMVLGTYLTQSGKTNT